MAIKTTRWQPDTCECIIEYQWDTEDKGGNNRVFTGSNIVHACERHNAPNPNAHFAQVQADNRLKNNAQKVLKDNYPELTTLNEEGESEFNHSVCSFFLNLNRVLEVTITEPSFDTAKKSVAKGLIDIEIGEDDRTVMM